MRGGAGVAGGQASQELPNASVEEGTHPTTTILSTSTIVDAAQASPTTTPAPLDATEKHRSSAIVAAAEDAETRPAFASSSEQQNNRGPEDVDDIGEPSAIADSTVSGCQSSAECNIWSAFNPIWTTFSVSKARLSKATDAGVDWAGTSGRPDELRLFFGLKNPVNRA